MDWGMKNRVGRLIQPDGHCFIMPIDHGYFQGPMRNLERPGEAVGPLLPHVDALFVTRGVLRSAIDPLASKPVILRVSGGVSMAARPGADEGDLANEGLTTSIEEILRLNATAVGMYLLNN